MTKPVDYETHLAATVLNDGRIVSYRLLSRELKIHSNAAKRMLYEFHKKQNAKKAGSVHATYLINGTPKPIITEIERVNGNVQDGEDVHMQSSPFVSSAVQEEGDKAVVIAAPSKIIILAREEDLEGAKSKLETIDSIHIYSLQPNMLKNLQTLSDCNRTVTATFNTEDPLVVGEQYGVIRNVNVRRRTVRRPLGVAPSVALAQKIQKTLASKAALEVDESKNSTPSSNGSNIKSEKPSATGKPSSSNTITTSSTKNPTILKKEHSDIFKSFSKPKPKSSTPTLQKETTESSGINSLAGAAIKSQERDDDDDDEPLKDAPAYDDNDDDEEEGEDFMPAIKPAPKTEAKTKAQTARSEREAQLRKMMDDDSDDGDDKNATTKSHKDLVGKKKDDDKIDQDQPPTANSPPSASLQEPSQSEPAPSAAAAAAAATNRPTGRRRLRRKVLKKKTTKDEEGYLVTKEEPVWESYSEDEDESKESTNIKERPVSSSAGKKATSGAGGSGKPAQGNIMSFFGKR